MILLFRDFGCKAVSVFSLDETYRRKEEEYDAEYED